MNAVIERDVCSSVLKTNEKIEVLDTESLDSSHIKKLARGECMVLQVKGFLDRSTCAMISKGAIELGYSPYLNVPSVRRIGMAFYETEGMKWTPNLRQQFKWDTVQRNG